MGSRTGSVLRGLALALIVPAVLATAARPAAAQFGPGPRALGMGGALTGLATGFEAVYWNPANLGLADRPNSSVGFMHPAFVGTVVGPELADFGILGEETPTAARQEEFLAGIPGTGLEFRGDATVPWVSFSAGRFGFGLATTVLGKADASRDLVELYLDARDDGELDPLRLAGYRVGETGYRAAAFTRATAAYAVAVDAADFPVTVGVAVHGVKGHRIERGRLFEPTVDDTHLLLTGIGLRSTGGYGFGVDLGAAARPAPGVTVGIAVENAFQRMHWSDDLEMVGGEFTTRELDQDGAGAILDRFEARPFDPAATPLESYEVAAELLEEAYMPAVLRLGAGYERGGTRAGATFSSTVGGGDLRAGWPRYFALGAEQRLAFLSLRAGWAASLDGASALTAGAGLHLGKVRLMAAGVRTLGSDEAPGPRGNLDGRRYAERLVAGSGYGFTVGLSVIDW